MQDLYVINIFGHTQKCTSKHILSLIGLYICMLSTCHVTTKSPRSIFQSEITRWFYLFFLNEWYHQHLHKNFISILFCFTILMSQISPLTRTVSAYPSGCHSLLPATLPPQLSNISHWSPCYALVNLIFQLWSTARTSFWYGQAH